MASYQWGLICQQAIVDRYTNNISYINAIEDISTSSFPAEIPNLFVSFTWRGDVDEEEIKTRIVVENEESEEIYKGAKSNLEFQGNKRIRDNNVIGGIEVKGAGTIWFCAEKKEDNGWTREASLPLDISRAS